MSYNPREIAILRQMIVEDQQRHARRGSGRRRGKKCNRDEEMEGGFLSAIASLGRLALTSGTRAALSAASTGARAAASRMATASRAALTRAPKPTSTAIVPYNPAAAALAKSANPSLLGRFGNYLKSGMTLGNAIGIGIPTGYSIYSMINDKKVAAEQEAQTAADTIANDQYMKDQLAIAQADVDKNIEVYNTQIAEAKASEKYFNDARKQQEDEYKKFLLQEEENKARQAKLEAEYEKEAQQQYKEMLEIQKQQIQEQIEQQLAALISASAPPPSSRAPPPPPSSRAPPPPPSSRAPPPPSSRAAPPPNTSADPYAGMTARERAAAQRTGRGIIRDDLLSRLRGEDISRRTVETKPVRGYDSRYRAEVMPVRPTPRPILKKSTPIRYIGPAY